MLTYISLLCFMYFYMSVFLHVRTCIIVCPKRLPVSFHLLVSKTCGSSRVRPIPHHGFLDASPNFSLRVSFSNSAKFWFCQNFSCMPLSATSCLIVSHSWEWLLHNRLKMDFAPSGSLACKAPWMMSSCCERLAHLKARYCSMV